MQEFVAGSWRDQFVLTRDLRVPAERAEFFAQVRRGDYVAVLRGVYVAAQTWSRMRADERYRMLTLAVAARDGSGHVFSHQSAASLWRLPWVGSWPTVAHVTTERAAGGRSNASLFRHTLGLAQPLVAFDGVLATTLARTVIDVARVASFAQAVVVADAALRRTAHPIAGVPSTSLSRDDLVFELGATPLVRGCAKARAVVHFADGAADRPGESLSRVSMRAVGAPTPRLQEKVVGASGKVYFGDFFWPTTRLVGEFDGEAKYRDPEFLSGRTPEQALRDEKAREDDIRAAGYGMTRWGWAVARSPARMRAQLVAAGLR
ncbi:MAG: hypothetical protein KF680_06745 [Cryobacterium sp.]|nr:hypothetical protein [Cryobacterium sp.]